MKRVKEFSPEEVQDFILLCLRTNWTTLGYANKMQKDLNAAIAKQKEEREAEEKADLPFRDPAENYMGAEPWKASDMYKNGEHPERFR